MKRTRWGSAVVLTFAALLQAHQANAFCGFYVAGSNEQLTNNATQVALYRDGTRTVLSMRNNYKGPAANFAMVVPVPVVLQESNVKTLPQAVFDNLEALTGPRLVEYWEQDPCDPAKEREQAVASGPMVVRHARPARRESDALGVTVEAEFVVGEYQIVILSATESTGLETWLHNEHYNIPAGAAEALAPYIREQWKFFVAKVDVTKVKMRSDGSATLSPLRFHYDHAEFRLPVRLGLLNAPDAQDLIVYVLNPTSRFEVANYPNVTIPTNLDVEESVRSNFGSFYAALFDRTLQQSGGRVVVTEYAWSASSCDPCPTPPLSARDIETLGHDTMPKPPSAAARNGRFILEKPNDVEQLKRGRPMGYFGGGPPTVLTRLHTRYNKAVLTEDLVFREAPAIVGGREFVSDANGELEHGSRPAPYGGNNFQARYAIRHPWTGPITCSAPRRGVWGGPPGGAAPSARSAQDLANVNRTAVALEKVVFTAAPEIGLAAAARPTELNTVSPANADAGSLRVDAAVTASTQTNKPASAPPAEVPKAKSCGCSTPGTRASGLCEALVALCVGFACSQRRRRTK